jgi:serine acetyltransferase
MLKKFFNEIYSNNLEKLAIIDLLTFRKKDPTLCSFLNILTNFKGYKSVQIYRISNEFLEI